MKFLSKFKYRLVGTLRWSINWTDAGYTESGHWYMYENGFGHRKFVIDNRAIFTSRDEHPGYVDMVLWKKNNIFPKGAVRYGW